MAKYSKQKKTAKRNKKREFSPQIPEMGNDLSIIDTIAISEVQRKIQELLELERDEIVGRSWHAHHGEDMPLQYRNGYGKPRSLTCGSGTMQLQMPRLRQPYTSEIVGKYQRLTKAMKILIPQLYLHGLSTGDFEPAFGWLWGDDAPLSPATILRLKEKWQAEYEQWKNQPLEEEYLYLWADGIYPKGGTVDESLAILVVLGVNRKGEKKLLALEEGYRESEEAWTDLFRGLRARGVKWIGLIIGDGLQGLWKSARKVFPVARQQRCWVHKMRNILDKVPKKDHDQVLGYLRSMYNASSYSEAQRLKREFITRYRSIYPKAVQSLLEAGESLFTYFRFHRLHWKSIKTTNPIESLFATVKLRTAAARRLRNRMSAVCLVFQLLKKSERRLNKLRAYSLVADIIDSLRHSSKNSRYAA